MDAEKLEEHLKATASYIERHRSRLTVGGAGYSDVPCSAGFTSKLPLTLSALDMADMEAAFVGGLAKYCMAVGSVPRASLKAFWFINGECRGLRGDRLAELRQTARHLIRYAPFVIGTEGVQPLLDVGEEIRGVSKKMFPQEDDDWLTVEQACELTGRSARTLRRWHESGWVETLNDNWGLMYSRKGLLAALDGMKEKQRQSPGRPKRFAMQ